MPTTLLLAPPDFQTFLRPWIMMGGREAIYTNWSYKNSSKILSNFKEKREENLEVFYFIS